MTVVRDEDDIRCNLEWLDTDDPVEPVKVYDWRGRRVRLKVEALEIEILELMKDAARMSRRPGVTAFQKIALDRASASCAFPWRSWSGGSAGNYTPPEPLS